MISKETSQIILEPSQVFPVSFSSDTLTGFKTLIPETDYKLEKSLKDPIDYILEKIDAALLLEKPNVKVYGELRRLTRGFRFEEGSHRTITPFANLHDKWKNEPKIAAYIEREYKRFDKKWRHWYGLMSFDESGTMQYKPGHEARFMKKLRIQNIKTGNEMGEDELNKKALEARSCYFFPTMTIASLDEPVSVAEAVPIV